MLSKLTLTAVVDIIAVAGADLQFRIIMREGAW